MIPGFIEGLEKLSFGDKAILFIPSHLAVQVVREM
jgi:peptidylprolyl isomerase